MNEDQIRELLCDMREDLVPPGSLARVRQGVAESIEARRRLFVPAWRIAAAVGCLAVVGGLAGVAMRSRAGRSEPIQHAVQPPVKVIQAVKEQPPELPSPARPVQTRLAVRTARQVRNKQRAAPPPGAATLIRIETPDPEVVILLVADTGGS